MKNPPAAQFEILIDGKPRSYRDIKAVAMQAAAFLKNRDFERLFGTSLLRAATVSTCRSSARGRFGTQHAVSTRHNEKRRSRPTRLPT
jgi:hypothetical protein